ALSAAQRPRRGGTAFECCGAPRADGVADLGDAAGLAAPAWLGPRRQTNCPTPLPQLLGSRATPRRGESRAGRGAQGPRSAVQSQCPQSAEARAVRGGALGVLPLRERACFLSCGLSSPVPDVA